MWPPSARRNAPQGKRESLCFTPGGRQIYEAWCSLFPVAVPESQALVEVANRLALFILPWATASNRTPAEVFQDIKTWMYVMDRRGFYTRGIKLFDVLRDVEGWQSAKERGQITAQPLSPAPKTEPRVPWRDPCTAQEEAYSLQALLAQPTQIFPVSERSEQ